MNDELVTWALTAVELGGDYGRATDWFAAIGRAYAGEDGSGEVPSYDEFTQRLVEQGSRVGVDEAWVRSFTEALAGATTAPLDDVIAPMVEQADALPARYLEAYAALVDQQELPAESYAGDGDGDGAEAAAGTVDEESSWFWDEGAQIWHHLEDGAWVAQQSWDGSQWLALNQERTEWVPMGQPEGAEAEAELPEAEQPEAEQPEAEQPEAELPEAEQPEAEEQEPETEQLDVLADTVVAPAIEEALRGLDLADVPEEELLAAIERLLEEQLAG